MAHRLLQKMARQATRDANGRFVKGDPILSRRGVILGKMAKGRKAPWVKKNGKHFEKGEAPWNKGVKKTTNTGRTHFKKGLAPHNYMGGISKTRAYRNHYNAIYKARKRGAEGSHTFGDWETLLAQYDHTCPACGEREPKIKLTRDHIVPLARGGSNNIENIQPLCRSCNSKKHAKVIVRYEIWRK